MALVDFVKWIVHNPPGFRAHCVDAGISPEVLTGNSSDGTGSSSSFFSPCHWFLGCSLLSTETSSIPCAHCIVAVFLFSWSLTPSLPVVVVIGPAPTFTRQATPNDLVFCFFRDTKLRIRDPARIRPRLSALFDPLRCLCTAPGKGRLPAGASPENLSLAS